MNPKSRQTVFCTNIRVEQKQTVLHYQPETSRPFLRIGLATPNLVPQTKSEYALPSLQCMVNMHGFGATALFPVWALHIYAAGHPVAQHT